MATPKKTTTNVFQFIKKLSKVLICFKFKLEKQNKIGSFSERSEKLDEGSSKSLKLGNLVYQSIS
jgi:hypothetical protein